jgi:hypothetical protein
MGDTAVDVRYDRAVVYAVKNSPIHFYLFPQLFGCRIVTLRHFSPFPAILIWFAVASYIGLLDSRSR